MVPSLHEGRKKIVQTSRELVLNGMKLGRRQLLAIATASVFLSGCTGVMTKNQAALVGAATCGALGAMGGAVALKESTEMKPWVPVSAQLRAH